MNKRTALATAGLTAALALAPMTAAQAAAKPQINLSGQGTYTMSDPGLAVPTGTVTGLPFAGSFRAFLQAVDGTLPDPGVCEPGHATIRIRGSHDRRVVLDGDGTICGQYVQPPYVVTHVFTGRYDVASSSVRKLRGGDGWFEVGLANDGRASVSAYDS
jgi:hypothetical protein